MKHSTLGVSDFQFRSAFRELISDRQLKQALQRPSAVQRRNRRLPAFFVLSALIAWFFAAADKLPAILQWLCKRLAALPSDAAVYKCRARIGWAPIRWLRRQVIRPLAQPLLDPDSFYDGKRLLAIDGTTFTVADTPDNDTTLGRATNQKGASGYPMLRLVALCEVGTHALLDWIARAFRVGEQSLAARLYGRVPPDALLLADRNFHSYSLWEAARNGSFDLLIRIQSGPKFKADNCLGDGSYLAKVYPRRGKGKKERAIVVRVIVYCSTDEDGKEHTSRLLTSLLDAGRHPAKDLVELYHRRWEQEGVFKEIKSALAGRVTLLRSRTPTGVMQELEGLLLGHYVVRKVILEVAREKGVRPIEISFKGALRVLRIRLASARRNRRQGTKRRVRGSAKDWWQQTKDAIGLQKVQKRRKRRCPRKKKVTRAAWQTKRKTDKEKPVPTFRILHTDDGLS